MIASYNLTKEPWIPCVTLEGEFRELSLRELFMQAHELRGIEDDNPLIVASIYRLLLTIIHRSIDGPKSNPEWKTLWRSKCFDERITEYLDKWETRFDLFSETYPFYQSKGFDVLGSKTPISKLNPEMSSQNNNTLFDHSSDHKLSGIKSSQLIKSLLIIQNFSIGGGVSLNSNLGVHPNFSDGSLISRVIVFVLGENLFETLLHNLLIYHDNFPISKDGKDMPVWEQDNEKPLVPSCRKNPSGYTDFLTWQSRHILLIPVVENNEIICRECHFSQRDILKDRNSFIDPLCWYQSEKEAYSLNPTEAFWRDSSTLFQFSQDPGGKDNRPKNLKQVAEFFSQEIHKILLIGLANSPKSHAKILLWRQEILPLPKGILKHHSLVRLLIIWLQNIDKVEDVLKNGIRYFAGQLLTGGLRKPEKEDVTQMVNSLNTLQEFRIQMEPLFQEFMKELSESTDLTKWTKRSKHIANDIFIKTTDNALSRSQRELRARILAEKKLNDDFKKIGQQVKENT